MSAPHFILEKSRRRRRLLTLAAILVLGACIVERRWFLLNDITTGATAAYPELQAHIYAADAATTRTAAEAAIDSLRRWKLVETPEIEGGETPPLHAEVRSFLFHFVDDVTVRFETIPATPPRTRVVIRSHSRVGKGDLGENARSIRALQAAMDIRLPLI